MRLKYFSYSDSPDELKRKYRELALKLHPDKGGSTAEFQKMSLEYAFVRQQPQSKQTDFYKHYYHPQSPNINIEDEITELLQGIEFNHLISLGIGVLTGLSLMFYEIDKANARKRKLKRKKPHNSAK